MAQNRDFALHALRKELSRLSLDAFVVPSGDAHQSEYVADCDKRREFVSGFNGSAGCAVVTKNDARLWTDSRYFAQASKQLSPEWTLMKQGQDGVPTLEKWLAKELSDDKQEDGSRKKVGVDPWLLSASGLLRFEQAFKQTPCEIVSVDSNPVDQVWAEQRPGVPSQPLLPHGEAFTGQSVASKVYDLRQKLRKERAFAVLVSALDEVAWLFNLRGSDIPYNPVFFAYAIVTQNDVTLFVRNGQVADDVHRHLLAESQGCKDAPAINVQLRSYHDVHTATRQLSAEAASQDKKCNRVWVDLNKTSLALRSQLHKCRLVTKDTPMALMKAVKNPVELEGMRQAHLRDAVAVCEFLFWLEKEVESGKQHDEVTVATHLEALRSQQKDFMGLSFETISASGANGAVIHYSPKPSTAARVDAEHMYLVDSGGQYRDGTTDITRTVHFGQPSEFMKLSFTRVLQGHIALASAVFPPGTVGPTLDVLARLPLWRAGLAYRHGTGHGVGSFLNVHEGPHGISSTTRSSSVLKTALRPGMTTSNEPGYYHEGEFGIRIESIMIVREVKTEHNFEDEQYLGFETIALVPLQRKLLDMSLLSTAEVEWINEFHADCLRKVSPLLKAQGKDDVLEWVRAACVPISKE